MEAAAACLQLQCMAPRRPRPSPPNKLMLLKRSNNRMRMRRRSSYSVVVNCSDGGGGGGGRISIGELIGGDLVKLDLGRWLSDLEEHKALAIYSPHEGGYEGRYLNRLRYQGYYFLDLSARGLGDPETTLINIHPVCPVIFIFSLSFYFTF